MDSNDTSAISLADTRAKSLQKARQPQSAVQAKQKPKRWPYLVLGLVCFALGLGSGVQISRMRGRSRELMIAINSVPLSKPEFTQRLETLSGTTGLRGLMAEEMQYQYAKKLGVAPTPAELDARIAEELKQPDFGARLASHNQTLEDYKHTVRAKLSQIAVLTKGIKVTPEEEQRYYASNTDKDNLKALFYTPATTVIAVIVTNTEQEGQKALAALRAGGADGKWENVVARYSQDISKKNRGILAPVQYGRSYAHKIPGLEETVFQLGVGQQTGPRQFAKKWWIIHCLDKKAAMVQPYAQVADQCRIGAMLSKVSPDTIKSILAGFSKFQTESNVQVFAEQYKQAAKLR